MGWYRGIRVDHLFNAMTTSSLNDYGSAFMDVTKHDSLVKSLSRSN